MIINVKTLESLTQEMGMSIWVVGRYFRRKSYHQKCILQQAEHERCDQDYEHVQQVWNRVIYEFEDVSLGDYNDVYLATDVSLLAGDFVNF